MIRSATRSRETALGPDGALLSCENLLAGYDAVPVVRDLTIGVAPGEVVALLGSNGAGKSTTLLTLSGAIPALGGTIRWAGEPISAALHKRARLGLRLITEDRSIFMSLTVADNLRLAYKDIRPCLELFPELEPLLSRRVGLLSGGEQQMLALARALAGDCRALLVDELSLGLAPLVTDRLLEAVRAAAARGVAVLLVEQQLDRALRVADRAYILRRGRTVMDGTVDYISRHMSEVEDSYLAASGVDINANGEL